MMNKSTKIVLVLIGALTFVGGIVLIVQKKNIAIAFGALIIGAGLIVMTVFDKAGKTNQERENPKEDTHTH